MKKPKSPAFSFYTADWNGSVRVRLMSLEQRGAFITLLAAAWDEVGLADDEAYIASLLGMKASSPRFKKLWGAIRPAFFLEDGRWYNRRQEVERARQAEFSAKQAGRAKGRWGDRGDAGGKPRHTRGNPNGRNAIRGMPPDPDPFPKPPNPRESAAGLGVGEPTAIADVVPKALPPEAGDAWRKMLSGEVPAPKRGDVA